MKARRVAGRDGAGDSGKCSDASGEALRPFPVPPGWTVGGVCSQYDRLEIGTLGDDQQ